MSSEVITGDTYEALGENITKGFEMKEFVIYNKELSQTVTNSGRYRLYVYELSHVMEVVVYNYSDAQQA